MASRVMADHSFIDLLTS